MVTSQQHTLYAGQKVLESRKADNVALCADRSLRLLLVSIVQKTCVSEETYVKLLSLVDAAGPAKEQREVQITDTVTTKKAKNKPSI